MLTILSLLLLLAAASFSSSRLATGSQAPRTIKATVSADVKRAAKKLAFAWVETASAETLDSLANRSIAFSGMVAGLYVTLDSKAFNAGQALIDSALTILKSNTLDADAGAIRNTVYALMEIAEGRVFHEVGPG